MAFGPRGFLALGFAALLAGLAACSLNTTGEAPVDGSDGVDTPVDVDGHVEVLDDGREVREDATPPEDGEAGDDGDEPEDAAEEESGPICGNGLLEAGEECDDGPDNSDTEPGACRTDCRAAHCGDAVTDPSEECDDGPDNSDTEPGACRTDCARFSCGDGVVDPGEACEPALDPTNCRDDCSLRTCGDGALDDGEECDDGNDDDTDACLSTCVAASCGDGAVWVDHEECDLDPPADCTAGCGSTGSRDCVACAWAADCTPPEEDCNGLDDDCDLSTDETYACLQGAVVTCATPCGSSGTGTCTLTCTLPVGTDCTPPAETCNGADDDCDTATDDGYECVLAATGSCPTTCGTTGSRICGTGCAWGACTPPAEACNGADDDCDTTADETFACAVGAARTCSTACSTTGSQTCVAGCSWGTCTPPAETCNGADDNCDSAIDEGFACALGATRSCTTSCGAAGSQTCAAGCTWSACAAGAELCNNADDDCDGATDETFACRQGAAGVSCTTTCGTTGTGTCAEDCSVPAPAVCTPPAETCNGADDNCDVTCDNGPGMTCCRGLVRTCRTGCGTTGNETCGTACTWGACAPPAETCNNVDDDCDAATDETFACRQNATGVACTNSCGAAGTTTCSATCTLGACCGAAELCGNTCDDDCDGTTNEGCGPVNDACAGAIDITAGGDFTGNTDTATSDVTHCASGGGCPAAGRDLWFRFTLTQSEVVFLSLQDGNAWDSVLDVRQLTSCSATTSTAIACNDDSCGGGNRRSQWAGTLAAGTYYVVVDACGDGEHGAFRLRYRHSACPGALAAAAPGRFSGSTCTAGTGNDTSSGCGGSNSPDQPYYVALCPGSFTLHADDCDDDENWSASVYIRSGTGGTCGAAETACDYGSCGNFNVRADLNATVAGPDLFFVVQDARASWSVCGSYDLDIAW